VAELRNRPVDITIDFEKIDSFGVSHLKEDFESTLNRLGITVYG
jgi:hypothetical protein